MGRAASVKKKGDAVRQAARPELTSIRVDLGVERVQRLKVVWDTIKKKTRMRPRKRRMAASGSADQGRGKREDSVRKWIRGALGDDDMWQTSDRVSAGENRQKTSGGGTGMDNTYQPEPN